MYVHSGRFVTEQDVPTKADFVARGHPFSHRGNWAGTSRCDCPKCGFCFWKADDKRDEEVGFVWPYDRIDRGPPVFRAWAIGDIGYHHIKSRYSLADDGRRPTRQFWSAYECLSCGFYGQCFIKVLCKTHTIEHQQMCHMYGKDILYHTRYGKSQQGR